MKTTAAVGLALSLTLVLACKKDEKSTDDSKGESATEPAGKTTEPAATQPAVDMDKPAAAAYSDEAAKKALGEMSGCKSRFDCPALKTLIGFGDKASEALAAVAIDAAKSKEERQVALHGLTEIKDGKVGMKLFEAGKVEKDFIVQNDLFKAAAAGGDDATFKAMIEHYAADESKKYRTGLGFGVKSFDKAKIFAWASENYPKDEDKQVRFANLVMDSAAADNVAAVEGLLGKTKHSMAGHRLASALVKLGDVTKFDILIAGLKSKDQYDRSDAANMLAKVVDKLPADKKAEVVDLVTKAKAKDRGGLTSIGYDRILKKLK